MWCEATAEPQLHFAEDDLAAVSSLWERDSQAGRAGNLLRLCYYRLVERQEASYVPAVPVLAYGPATPLQSAVEQLSQRLVLEAIAPVVVPLQILARKLSQTLVDCFVQAACRLLLEHSIDYLLTEQLLPPLPDEPSRTFGFWLWRGWQPPRLPVTTNVANTGEL